MEQVYKELLQKYNSILEENKRLRDELTLLKGETSLSMTVTESIEHVPIIICKMITARRFW